MAGLLDILDSDQGRLGIGLLAAAGPSATPMGFGQRLAQGVGYVQAQGDAADKRKWEKLLRDRQMLAFGREDKVNALAPNFMQPAQPAQGATMGDAGLPAEFRTGGGALPEIPGKPAAFDLTGYATALMGIDPQKGVALMQALQKDSHFGKIDPKDYTQASVAKFALTKNPGDLVAVRKLDAVDGTVMDLYDPSNKNRVAPNPNKPFSGFGADGKPIPNQAYMDYEVGKAKAGAATTSVKIDNKTGEGLAAQIGPMMKDSASAADGAVKQIDAADRMIKAIDTNKLFSGPGASLKMLAGQMGVPGANDAEKIANTRAVIRAASELTLQGRKQMSGQGAITESEGKLAERAMSGDIDSMTAAELRQIANASKRAAQFNLQQHQRKLEVMSKDPNLAPLVPFYSTQSVEPAASESPKPTYRYENGKLVEVK